MHKRLLLYIIICLLGVGSLVTFCVAHVKNTSQAALESNATESSQIVPTKLSATVDNSANPTISSRLAVNSPLVKEIDPEYAADFSDDRILVGASHNIFVGKVMQQVGNKNRGIGPETQFQVQVISNIKGDLSGNVEVDQQGGYENGVLYVVGDGNGSGDVVSPVRAENSYLLQSGSTYLFATRYNPQENWYTLNPYPTASKLLSADSALSSLALQNLASSDTRVQQLKAAYPNEISLSADVAHNNAINNYQQFSTTIENTATMTTAFEATDTSSIASTSSFIVPITSSTESTMNISQATSTAN